MTLLLKDPDAALDYAVDWGAEYLGGDSLAESAWDVTPAEENGVSVLGHEFDQLIASVKAGGGIPGHICSSGCSNGTQRGGGRFVGKGDNRPNPDCLARTLSYRNLKNQRCPQSVTL